MILQPTRVYPARGEGGGPQYVFEHDFPERPGVPPTRGSFHPPSSEIRHLLNPRPLRQAYNRPPYLSGWRPGDPEPPAARST
jgi:hypothetical protein